MSMGVSGISPLPYVRSLSVVTCYPPCMCTATNVPLSQMPWLPGQKNIIFVALEEVCSIIAECEEPVVLCAGREDTERVSVGLCRKCRQQWPRCWVRWELPSWMMQSTRVYRSACITPAAPAAAATSRAYCHYTCDPCLGHRPL